MHLPVLKAALSGAILRTLGGFALCTVWRHMLYIWTLSLMVFGGLVSYSAVSHRKEICFQGKERSPSCESKK